MKDERVLLPNISNKIIVLITGGGQYHHFIDLSKNDATLHFHV